MYMYMYILHVIHFVEEATCVSTVVQMRKDLLYLDIHVQ